MSGINLSSSIVADIVGFNYCCHCRIHKIIKLLALQNILETSFSMLHILCPYGDIDKIFRFDDSTDQQNFGWMRYRIHFTNVDNADFI